MSRIIVNIPEGTSGDFSIQKITTNHIGGRDEPQDTYTVLYKDGIENIMQDTTHEYDEHQPLWDNATGDVLIGGLGIGFVNQKLIDNPNVTSVTIVEKNQEVIDLVWNNCPKDGTFTIIQDALEVYRNFSYFELEIKQISPFFEFSILAILQIVISESPMIFPLMILEIFSIVSFIIQI